jgi:hypothetical protein
MHRRLNKIRMDTQSLFNLGGGAILSVCGWLLKGLWDANQRMTKSVHALEVLLPSSYVQKADLDARLDKIEAMIGRVFERMDQQADRRTRTGD